MASKAEEEEDHSSTDPLLPPPSTSSAADAESSQQTQQQQQQRAVEIPVTHLKQPNQNIRFRIGAYDTSHGVGVGGASDDLGVLQELLTSHSQQHQPIGATPISSRLQTADEGLTGKKRRSIPQRMSSVSSIMSSSADSSECLPLHDKFTSELAQPKEVLIELFDLKMENGSGPQGCWEETARWIKYEEDVEGVDHQRWGLPHISFLSFHALLQLRKCIGKGVVLLDVDVTDFDELMELIVGAVVASGHEFGAQNARKIAQILRLKHHNVCARSRRMSRISTTASTLTHYLTERAAGGAAAIVTPRRSTSAVPLTQAATCALSKRILDGIAETGTLRRVTAHSPPTIAEDDEGVADSTTSSLHQQRNRLSAPRSTTNDRKLSTPNVKLTFDTGESPHGDQFLNVPAERTMDCAEEANSTLKLKSPPNKRRQSCNELHQKQHKSSVDLNGGAGCSTDVVLKKLPDGVELVQVLVGEIHWMRKPRFVMVRFAEGRPLPEMVGNNHPVRIVFVILGPALSDGSYHELGRSLATLVANTHFKSIAFGARDRSHLIEGLDSFLDGSLVIPPGKIASKRLLSGDALWKEHRKWQREREMRKQQKVATTDSAEPPYHHQQQQQQNNASNEDEQQQHLSPQNNVAGSQNQQNGRTQRHNDSFGETTQVEQKKGKENGQQQQQGREAEKEKKKPEEFPLFKGLRTDLSNRLPYYWSDIRDAANFQCLTSIVFMFFASFVPAISFGGLMGKYTNEHIGTIETLFAQCICGVIWGLFAAQPLMIMSATGPVLIFEASLYNFCESLQLDFLTVRFYAGLFIMLITICVTALDGSRLLVFVTRFTEDIFATLISAIFIAESLHFILHTFQQNPVEDYNYYERIHINCADHLQQYPPAANNNNYVEQSQQQLDLTPTLLVALPFDIESIGNSTRNRTADAESALRLAGAMAEIKTDSSALRRFPCGEAEPNTALLTAIIVFSTFILAFLLKKLRESFYLGKHLRRALGDFGVLISITLVALIVHWGIPDPYLQRLDMPDHINFTNPEKRGHGLLVTPKLTLQEWYGVCVAFVAALLVFILLFVETEITELLLMRKERGCKKGSGMHWDLVLMGICAFLCSVFGLPWMCAAAVQSLAHCSSLMVMKKTAPGARPEVDHVIEQRVTTIGVAMLIGLIAFGGSYLRLPLASLFGVFLYLGVMNLCGVQLIQRVVLFFIPEKYFPVAPYTEQMSIWRMHLYTWIQLICVFIVYTVKYFKKTALAFPFVLMLFIFFRQIILPRIFTEKELEAIDGNDHSAENEEWVEKDYYDNPQLPV